LLRLGLGCWVDRVGVWVWVVMVGVRVRVGVLVVGGLG
jgi:hypothetical protein